MKPARSGPSLGFHARLCLCLLIRILFVSSQQWPWQAKKKTTKHPNRPLLAQLKVFEPKCRVWASSGPWNSTSGPAQCFRAQMQGLGQFRAMQRFSSPNAGSKPTPPSRAREWGVEWVDRVGWVWGGVGWLLLWCCLHAVAGLAPASSQH